jgi:hypothetical protein
VLRNPINITNRTPRNLLDPINIHYSKYLYIQLFLRLQQRERERERERAGMRNEGEVGEGYIDLSRAGFVRR